MLRFEKTFHNSCLLKDVFSRKALNLWDSYLRKGTETFTPYFSKEKLLFNRWTKSQKTKKTVKNSKTSSSDDIFLHARAYFPKYEGVL